MNISLRKQNKQKLSDCLAYHPLTIWPHAVRRGTGLWGLGGPPWVPTRWLSSIAGFEGAWEAGISVPEKTSMDRFYRENRDPIAE